MKNVATSLILALSLCLMVVSAKAETLHDDNTVTYYFDYVFPEKIGEDGSIETFKPYPQGQPQGDPPAWVRDRAAARVLHERDRGGREDDEVARLGGRPRRREGRGLEGREGSGCA